MGLSDCVTVVLYIRYGTLRPSTMQTLRRRMLPLKWTLSQKSRFVPLDHVSHRLNNASTSSALQVGNDVSVKSLARSVDPDTPTLWYAQDAGGAIWKIDIAVSHTVMCVHVCCLLSKLIPTSSPPPPPLLHLSSLAQSSCEAGQFPQWGGDGIGMFPSCPPGCLRCTGR